MGEVGLQKLGAQIKRIMFEDTAINWTVSFSFLFAYFRFMNNI